MKLDLTKILLVAALLFIGWQNFINVEPDPEPDPVTITLPSTDGTTGIVDIEPEVVRDTIYMKGGAIEVDRGYKELYEKTKDSLERKVLYLRAIKINKYSDTIVDNNEIVIKGEATTRGDLLNYSVDYTIKPQEFTYTPEVVTRLPKLSLGLGLEAGVPLIPESNFVLKANVDLMNSKGNRVNLSYDTEQRVWFGLTKTFRLIR